MKLKLLTLILILGSTYALQAQKMSKLKKAGLKKALVLKWL